MAIYGKRGSNAVKYAYRLGRALMLPVACLPVAGLLMGIGFWMDPIGHGGQLSAFTGSGGCRKGIDRQYESSVYIGGSSRSGG